MSGFLNSIGAKSGIIGHTEQRFESGTWDPTDGGGPAQDSATNGKYLRIGQLCYIHVYIEWSASGTLSAMDGLPFTTAVGEYIPLELMATGGPGFAGTATAVNIHLMLNSNNTTFDLRASYDGSSFSNTVTVADEDAVWGQGVYLIKDGY